MAYGPFKTETEIDPGRPVPTRTVLESYFKCPKCGHSFMDSKLFQDFECPNCNYRARWM
jgi:DNA-directed RNA polymerase subunit RPC12/RpoP